MFKSMSTYPRDNNGIVKSNFVTIGNSELLHSHALDRIRCMQIYPRLSKSIATDKHVLKNNMDIIENIHMENKTTYL